MAATGMERNAVRSLPASLTHILLVYLVVVEPFVHFLHQTLNVPNRRGVLFSIRNRMAESERLSKDMYSESMALIGKGLRIGSWRHISQGFIRYGMGEAFQQDSIDPPEVSEFENEALAAGQAHHSVRTAQLIYGRPQVQFANLPVSQQEAFMGFSQRWHGYIGLPPDFNFVGSLYRAVQLPIPRHRETAPASQSQVTLSHLEKSCLKYVWPASDRSVFGKGLSVGQFDRFFALSSPRYSPGELVSDEFVAGDDANDYDISQQIRLPPLQPISRVPQGDLLLQLLREFLGNPGANFRVPEQRQVLYHILARCPCLFSILPTAGGKTTLILLVASLVWSKTTVLVVPLVALKEDLKKKLERLGLPYGIWEELGRETPAFPLVLVSAEKSVSEDFNDWAMGLHYEGRLDRIVFDEAHLIDLAVSYRPVMRHVSRLVEVGVPLVLMSATMTPAVENRVRSQLKVTPHGAVVVRGNANRPNIFYSVVPVPAEKLSSPSAPREIMALLPGARPELATTEVKAIVFLNTRAEVENFKRQVPEAAFYHAGLPEQVKKEELASFQRSDGGANVLAHWERLERTC